MSAPADDRGRALCAPTAFLDHEAPTVRAFLHDVVPDPTRPHAESAVALYYAVRDGVQYEIYGADLSADGMRASAVAVAGRGLCMHKSILYAACTRALGIPSRLVLVDVRNHVASPRLKELLGGDVVRFHCYTELRLDGRWVKVAPVFSERLCRLYRMTPLEFDGVSDAVLQPYDEDGRAFIETVHEHGTFDDLPYAQVIAGLREAHPRIFAGRTRVRPGSLAAEAAEPAC